VWGLEFSGYPEDEGDPVGPAKTLTLTLPKGDSAVLRVKPSPQAGALAAKALGLVLPAGVEFIPLERQAAPAQVREVITGGDDGTGNPAPDSGR
jgi:hypothetical protein